MKLTYINLLNGYYNSPAFTECSLSCHSLIMALLKKANSLGFRKKFTATNHEMQHLSKIEAVSTFCRARNEMLALEVDGKKVFSYKNGRRGSTCGEYSIEYAPLLNYSQFFQNNENSMGVKWESSESQMGTLIEKNREDQIRKEKEKKEKEMQEFEFKIQDFSRAFANICPGSCNWTIRDHHKLLVDLANAYKLEDLKPMIQEFWDAGSTRGELLSSVHAALTGGKS